MRRLLHTVLLLSAMSLILLACAPIAIPAQTATRGTNTPASPTTLTVFAAASLTGSFGEIGERFSAAHPDVKVSFNFAGSNQPATQIGEGAPADLFASANSTQINVVIESGRIVSGTQRTFVHNRLVVVTPSDNPAGVTALPDLAKAGVKVVFAAKVIPVGQYALDFLDKAEVDGTMGADYKQDVLANVVSYEKNVRAVLAKVTLGDADAGIVYTSDIAANREGEVGQIVVADNLNTIASYPIAPLADSPNLLVAKQFINDVLSPEGQQILAKYGFIPISEVK